MSLILGQRAVSTVPTFVCTAPAGSFTLVLTGGTAATYLSAVNTGASGTAVTTSTGALLPASAVVTYTGFPGSSAQDIYAVAAVSSTVSYHICTDR